MPRARERDRDRADHMQRAAAGGGGGGAVPESELVSNAGILLWMNPTDDAMYKTDATDTPVNKATDNEDVARWVPGVKPADLDYYVDTAAAFAKYRTNLINGNAAVQFAGAQAQLAASGVNFRTNDLFAAGAAVVKLVIKIDSIHGTVSINVIQDGFSNSVYLRQESVAGGSALKLIFDMTSDVTLTLTAGGDGWVNALAWLHDGQVDWWLNGIKQLAVTGVDTITTLTRADWGFRNFDPTNWTALRIGAGTGAGATEAAMAALHAHCESLLGRLR